MNRVLSAHDLSKTFGRLRVLDGMNLEVAEGSIFAFVGPNGAGKTTTIKILMNLLKPSSGSASILGVDSSRLGPGDYARIGYVSEKQLLPDWMTVAYFLNYLKPFHPTWDDARARELLAQFDVPLDHKLRNLSRGTWMKALLISSLAYRPQVLVLDEPFSGLDPVAREDMIQGLLESASETTVFISSHDLPDIESFASHIGYLDAGRLLFAEEMASLSARCREVELIVEPPARVPEDRWPSTWLRPEAAQATVRFVDSAFEQEQTISEIRRRFAGVQHISVNPMPLRSIFVILARNARQPS